MKIQAIATQPSFTAKLKENAVTTNLIKGMDKKQKAEYDSTIALLDKTNPGKVIEYDVTGKDYLISPSGKCTPINLYGFKNLDNEELQVGVKRLSAQNFLETLKAVATEGTKENKKIFNA